LNFETEQIEKEVRKKHRLNQEYHGSDQNRDRRDFFVRYEREIGRSLQEQTVSTHSAT
jgi:hypothetical protein